MLISLSILNADLDHIENLFQYPPLSYSPVNHMDIMDGKFVSETSFTEEVVKRAHEACPQAIVDVHLMVENPKDYFLRYKNAGADYITFHVEVGDTEETIKYLKELGMKVGLSLNPSTPVSDLLPYLKDIDLVLVMSVWPGRGGQKFIPESIDKLKELSEYKHKNNLTYVISVDGGINEETIPLVKEYADMCVVGSAITRAEKPFMKYAELLKMSM